MNVDPKALRQKIYDARRWHSVRLRAPVPVPELERRYGWTVEALLAAITAAIRLGYCECGRCERRPYVVLGDISVDVLEPELAPYWGANTRVIHTRCNITKGPRSPVAHAVADAERAARARDEAERFAPGPGQLDLFGGEVPAPAAALLSARDAAHQGRRL